MGAGRPLLNSIMVDLANLRMALTLSNVGLQFFSYGLRIADRGLQIEIARLCLSAMSVWSVSEYV